MEDPEPGCKLFLRCKSYTAGILLELRVVEALLHGQSSSPAIARLGVVRRILFLLFSVHFLLFRSIPHDYAHSSAGAGGYDGRFLRTKMPPLRISGEERWSGLQRRRSGAVTANEVVCSMTNAARCRELCKAGWPSRGWIRTVEGKTKLPGGVGDALHCKVFCSTLPFRLA